MIIVVFEIVFNLCRIFNLRRGVNNRMCGFIIALAEVVILIIPYSITAYTPIYFYGSLLVFIAVDLISDWLVSYVYMFKCWLIYFAYSL